MEIGPGQSGGSGVNGEGERELAAAEDVVDMTDVIKWKVDGEVNWPWESRSE
jgi:hypothetical protein